MRPRASVLGIALAGLFLLAARPVTAGEESRRTVTIRLVVDRSVFDLTEWRFKANAFLEYVSRIFRSQFGIDLCVKGPGRWSPGPRRRSIEDALCDLASRVPADGCDIVMGFIDPEHLSSTTLGIASYTRSSILLSNALDENGMRYAFLHELCHICGAIDLMEKGSLMSVSGHGMRIDPFTADVVRLNRDRLFDRGRFPLTGADVDAAIELYRTRVSQGPGEPETYLFLTLFYLEKDDLDAATKACTQAVVAEPGLIGIQIMLGNLRLRRGQPELAAGHYEKALEQRTTDPGLLYNLGLAYVEMRRYGAAAAEFRAALKVSRDNVPARLALARLLLAAGSSEAAVAECRRTLESDPRSAEALCLLGASMVAQGAPFTPDPEVAKEPTLSQPNTIRPGSPEAEKAVADAVQVLKRSIALDP